MTRGALLTLAALTALTLSACESSQTRSARQRAAAGNRAVEKGLQITRDNPNVRVASTTILTNTKNGRSAAVVEVRNTSQRPLVALPLLFTVTGGGGKKLFANDSPGASADLTTIPSLAAGDTLEWVNDAITGITGALAVAARVGEPKAPAGAPVPTQAMKFVDVHPDRDPVDGDTVRGRVVNPSKVSQLRLVIFATARRGEKIVAAGRAIVPVVKPDAKGAPFTIFFVGDPKGAKLQLQAPPVTAAGTP